MAESDLNPPPALSLQRQRPHAKIKIPSCIHDLNIVPSAPSHLHLYTYDVGWSTCLMIYQVVNRKAIIEASGKSYKANES